MSLTVEQLKLRMTGIGGSDVAAALGLSPWKTQLQLWADKCGKNPPGEETPAMEWGSRLETVIANKFRDEHPRYTLVEANETIRDSNQEFLLATPDGYLLTADDDTVGMWECKTSSVDWPDGLPIYYQLQVQHYLYISGLPMAIVSCLFRGREYQEYVVMADTEAYEKDVLPALKQFWTTVVDELPVFAPTTLTEMNWIVGEPDDEEPLVAGEDLLRMVERAKEAARISADSKSEADKCRMQLAEIMGRHKKLVDADGKSLASQYQTKDSEILDVSTLKKAEPEAYKLMMEKFTKTKKGYRAMRLAK